MCTQAQVLSQKFPRRIPKTDEAVTLKQLLRLLLLHTRGMGGREDWALRPKLTPPIVITSSKDLVILEIVTSLVLLGWDDTNILFASSD